MSRSNIMHCVIGIFVMFIAMIYMECSWSASAFTFLTPQHRGNIALSKSTHYMVGQGPFGERGDPLGGDMAYTDKNLRRQMEQYNSIRKIGGKDVVSDVYVRDPQYCIFWYAGKIARCTGTVSEEKSVARQWNIIVEHAARVRPIELGRKFSVLEIWTAPGDSELRISENDPTAILTQIDKLCPVEDVNLIEVGFAAEFVTDRGVGFRTERNEDGTPLKNS